MSHYKLTLALTNDALTYLDYGFRNLAISKILEPYNSGSIKPAGVPTLFDELWCGIEKGYKIPMYVKKSKGYVLTQIKHVPETSPAELDLDNLIDTHVTRTIHDMKADPEYESLADPEKVYSATALDKMEKLVFRHGYDRQLFNFGLGFQMPMMQDDIETLKNAAVTHIIGSAMIVVDAEADGGYVTRVHHLDMSKLTHFDNASKRTFWDSDWVTIHNQYAMDVRREVRGLSSDYQLIALDVHI